MLLASGLSLAREVPSQEVTDWLASEVTGVRMGYVGRKHSG